MKIFTFAFLFFITLPIYAADLKALSAFFTQNYDNFYEPRMCGKNIALLVSEAAKKNIDLSNSYVLKFEGAGFLETSGFYTRSAVNDRAMLGYFHFVLVADGYVFDFDLAEPLILKLEDYVRLQFTPPHQPFVVYGIKFDPLNQLPSWTVSLFDLESYLTSSPQISWTKQFSQLLNLENMMKKKRVR